MGGVIFLIITLVQFIPIVKGAERVAEVAARFTLDAMPGKQMSIDADMRADILDSNQARERRMMIQKESQLYGAIKQTSAGSYLALDIPSGRLSTCNFNSN